MTQAERVRRFWLAVHRALGFLEHLAPEAEATKCLSQELRRMEKLLNRVSKRKIK